MQVGKGIVAELSPHAIRIANGWHELDQVSPLLHDELVGRQLVLRKRGSLLICLDK